MGYENNIVFTISSGFLLSSFFWFLVVYKPTNHRKNLIKSDFNKNYSNFRSQTIQIFLHCLKEPGMPTVPELMDKAFFKSYFNQCKWGEVANVIAENETRRSELMQEIELFSLDVSYLLHNLTISNSHSHDSLRLLRDQLHRHLHPLGCGYESNKSLFRFLWELHTNWSFMNGYGEKDVIVDVVKGA